jgi:hypothetical protein
MAVEVRVRDGTEHGFDEAVAQGCQMRSLSAGSSRPRDLGRHAHADDAGHVLGARAQAALLPASHHHRRDPHPFAHVERADARRAVDVVARQGEQAHRHARHVDGQQPLGRDRVDVKATPVPSSIRAISGIGWTVPISFARPAHRD